MASLVQRIMSAAVDAALDQHSRVVVDSHVDPITGGEVEADGESIEMYYRAPGGGWAIRLGDVDYYSERDGDYWCGAFVAYCYHVAGDYLEETFSADMRLKPGLINAILSTLRLANPDKWREYDAEPPEIIEDPADIRRGDIVVFDTGRESRKVGDHITLAQEPPSGGKLLTVEGNAWGALGSGREGEGVVVNERPVEKIARIYRPHLTMFEGSYLC